MSERAHSINTPLTSAPSIHHSRSASLSIARSPTIPTHGQNRPLPVHHPSYDANTAAAAHPTPFTSLSPGRSGSQVQPASPSPSPSHLYSRRPQKDPLVDDRSERSERDTGIEGAGPRFGRDSSPIPSDEEELWDREYWQGFAPGSKVNPGEGRGLQAPFAQQEDSSVEDEEEGVGLGREGYSGGFQPPDSRELVGMVLSFAVVATLSTAAVLTTIYDWVL